MTKFGLIGNPIKNSRSPELFKNFYQDKYSYELIEGDNFEEVWDRFIAEYQGINITAPFKELAYKKLVTQYLSKDNKLEINISGPCVKIGATNLVIKTKHGFDMYNTDFDGFILSIAESYFPSIVKQCQQLYKDKFNIRVHQFVRDNLKDLFSKKPQALVVGCGGTGKAAAIACAELGFDTVIMNRSTNKVQAFTEKVSEYNFLPHPISDFREAVKECDLIIYTIPCALIDENQNNLIDSLSIEDYSGEERYGDIQPSKVILDVNYQTEVFGSEAKDKISKASCQYFSGDRLLYYQALTGFSLLTQ